MCLHDFTLYEGFLEEIYNFYSPGLQGSLSLVWYKLSNNFLIFDPALSTLFLTSFCTVLTVKSMLTISYSSPVLRKSIISKLGLLGDGM